MAFCPQGEFERMFGVPRDDVGGSGWEVGRFTADVQATLQSPETRRALQEEYDHLKTDQQFLKDVMFKDEFDNKWALPGNLMRLIMKAVHQFKLTKNQASDMGPQYIVEKVEDLLEKQLVVEGGMEVDDLDAVALPNQTTLYKILVRSILASRRVLMEFNMTREAFDWVIQTMVDRFDQAIVNGKDMHRAWIFEEVGKRDGGSIDEVGVGVLFADFLLLFGDLWEYDALALSAIGKVDNVFDKSHKKWKDPHPSHPFNPHRLTLQDPFDDTNDVGQKSFAIDKIRTELKAAHIALR
ncbi:DNA-directed RNA polymerase II subunit rpb1, partial [Rhizophlyctis rosea]